MYRNKQASGGALLVLGLAAMIGACSGGEAEPDPAMDDVELALDTPAEPELADPPVESDEGGEAPARTVETPARTAETPPPAPPPAQNPTQSSPVRGVPEAVTQPEHVPPTDEVAPEPLYMTVTASVGSELEAELVGELSTRTNKPGDRFELRVTSPLIDRDRVVVQMNSYITGEVTAVQRSGSNGEQAVIKLAFHEVKMLGQSWPISAVVVEAEAETRGQYSTGDVIARGGAGAVAGGILGRVIGGDATGAVVGAAIGAAAGTAITLATEDVDAVLPEGAVLRLRLDKPLTIQVPAS